MINVLGLCSYPIEAAATRYRLAQFVEPLKENGINLEISPFLDSAGFASLYQNQNLSKKIAGIGMPFFQRLSEISKIKKFDLIYVQREAMLFGPVFFEWIYQKVGNIPMILDLDDATYISYVSPTYGKVGSFFKFFSKTDSLIKRANLVVCGNRFIAEYVEKQGGQAIIVPTVVDTNIFSPIKKNNEIPIIGWIGTHSTFPLLQSIFPVLEELAINYKFILKIVGSGEKNVEIKGVTIENLPWKMERETEDFQSLDIGLYPIATSDSAVNEWILGKSGFKAIQYMAVGIPFVVTPIGVCAEMGEENITHLTATSKREWYNALEKLLADKNLRERLGMRARQNSLETYTVEKQVEILVNTFQKVSKIDL